jgi:phage virion morphogenesis protein
MTEIRIDVETAGYTNAFKKLAKKWGDLTPYTEAIGVQLEASIDENFDLQRSPSGRRWAALSPAYLKQKNKNPSKIKNAGILVLTGTMRKRVKAKAGKTSVSVSLRTADEAVKKRAAVHQNGSPSRNIPARPFMGIKKIDKEEISGILLLDPDRLRSGSKKKRR